MSSAIDNGGEEPPCAARDEENLDSDEERDRNRELLQAIRKGNLAKVRSLLESGVKMTVDRNNKDNTPLHYAVERNKPEIVEELLNPRWKADVNARNSEGETALEIARRLGYQDIIQILISHTQLQHQTSVEKQPATYGQSQNDQRQESVSTQLSVQQDSKKKMYQARKGTDGYNGYLYEILLLILGELRGNRDTDEFYLGTNLAGLGAFDDIVMKYYLKSVRKPTIVFVQAKYGNNSEQLTLDKFTNPKNDQFYLGKYFRDYLKIRDKFKVGSEDPVFEGDFHKQDMKYIIYTNRTLHEEFNESRKTDVGSCFFSTKFDDSKAFKFRINDENSDIISMLEKVCCQKVKLLAEVLVSYVTNTKVNGHKPPNYTNMMAKENIFSIYHVFLAKNVIDVQEKIEEDGKKIKYREGQIKQSFLDIDSSNLLNKIFQEEVLWVYAENFIFTRKSDFKLDNASERDVFINEAADSVNNGEDMNKDLIEKLSGNILILDTKNRKLKFAQPDKVEDDNSRQFIRDLENKVGKLGYYKCNLPYELVKKRLIQHTFKLHIQFGNINTIKKKEHFIGQLTKLCETHKSKKIIEIDDNLINNEKALTTGDVQNLGKLVGNLFIFDEKDKMLKLSNESINENTLELFEKLKSSAQSKGLDIFNYRFDVKIKSFPRDKLFAADEDRTNAKEFLSKLEIFTGQANVEELKGIIKDEIRDLCTLTEKEAEETFSKLRDTAEEYWGNDKSGQRDYLNKDDRFFKFVVRINIEFRLKPPSDAFSGRKVELTNLHDSIQNSSEKTTVIASISGLGGIGKTQLAAKYAHDHRKYYNDNVIWINAESYETLVDAFRTLASEELDIKTKNADGEVKSIESIVKEVYGFFSKRKCLFIFDNAEKFRNRDDGDEGIYRFLPKSLLHVNKPCILITSRNQKWGDINVIRLDPFTEKEAMAFVKETLKIEDDSQMNEIRKLAEVLQRFPLALAQAVAYIKQADEEVKNVNPEREYKIDDYLKEYEEKAKELLDFKFPDDSNDPYAKTTYTTWKITIDTIKIKTRGKEALELLDIIAYCAPENIPTKMFLKIVKGDERKLGATIQLLKQYSMVNLAKGVLSVHRLVQQVTRLNLKGTEKKVLREALELFQCSISIFDLFIKNLRLDNVDHAISVWRYANEHNELVRDFNQLPVVIVSELKASLRYEEADVFGRNELKLLRNMLGDDHFSVLSMMNNVGSLLYDQGKDKESLEMYRKLREKSDVINKPLLTEIIAHKCDNMIGLILNRQGNFEEASKIFSNLDLTCSTGEIKQNHGLVLFNQGKLDDAINMYKKALELKEKMLGTNHESTLNTMNSIAATLEAQGKYDDAVAKSWEVYKKRKEILGSNHPDTLTTYCNIAYTLVKLARYEEALKIAIEVDKEREKTIPNHPRTLKGKSLVVRILELQGEYDEALDKCKEVYEKRKKILGPSHQDTLDTLDSWYRLARKLAEHRDYDKVLKELNNVLEERKKIFYCGHPDISKVENAISIMRQYTARKSVGQNFPLADGEGKLDWIDYLLNFGCSEEEDNEEILHALLKNSVQGSDQGWTALHCVAQTGELHILNILLEGDTDVDVRTNDGHTPLHVACTHGHLPVVNALLKKNANFNLTNIDNLTPLHVASLNGHKNIIETLLKVKEMNVNVVSTNNRALTPLHYAAFNGHLNAVIALLDGGANINAVNEFNRKPVDDTTEDTIKKVLKSTQELFDAVKGKKSVFKIHQLLGDGARVNAISGNDRLTVLHFAVSNGDLAVIKALLKKRPNISAVDKDDLTPLHYALQDSRLDIVKLLIHHLRSKF